MKITMLHTKRGSEDGFVVRQFEAGQTYDVADTLARSFVSQEVAIERRHHVNALGFDTNPQTLQAKGVL